MVINDHSRRVGLKDHPGWAKFRITKTFSSLGKMALIAVVAMFTANNANAQAAANKQQAIQKSIKTFTQQKTG